VCRSYLLRHVLFFSWALKNVCADAISNCIAFLWSKAKCCLRNAFRFLRRFVRVDQYILLTCDRLQHIVHANPRLFIVSNVYFYFFASISTVVQAYGRGGRAPASYGGGGGGGAYGRQQQYDDYEEDFYEDDNLGSDYVVHMRGLPFKASDNDISDVSRAYPNSTLS